MNKTRIQQLLDHILNTPPSMWIMLGFSIGYIVFFIRPILFSAPVMQFFKYVPAADPIGIDLKQMLSYSQSWFVDKQTPYIGRNLYPPLASVLFTPLLFVKFSWAYKIVTLINVFCFVMITLVFPILICREKQVSSLTMLVFITGLFSYGFQFELERGQFNVIAVFICFLSIWIYYYHNKYRYLAYILFTISVQLKVFPLIFIVMLIDDWQDKRNNIKRLLILASLNFVLFFVLGPHVFVDFMKAIIAQTVNPDIGPGNHSIRSFVTLQSYKPGWIWIIHFSGLAQLALLAVIADCIFLSMHQAYRQNQKNINPLLMLTCTIGALLIPSVSIDYKLSILAAPVALLFSDNKYLERANRHGLNIIFGLLLLIFSTAYCSTLFSSTNKPLMFENNFPALITMLLAVTFLSLVYNWKSKKT